VRLWIHDLEDDPPDGQDARIEVRNDDELREAFAATLLAGLGRGDQERAIRADRRSAAVPVLRLQASLPSCTYEGPRRLRRAIREHIVGTFE